MKTVPNGELRKKIDPSDVIKRFHALSVLTSERNYSEVIHAVEAKDEIVLRRILTANEISDDLKDEFIDRVIRGGPSAIWGPFPFKSPIES